MRWMWELIILLAVVGIIVPWFIRSMIPFMPYILGTVGIGLVIMIAARVVYARYREW